jgi:hypothetical protein
MARRQTKTAKTSRTKLLPKHHTGKVRPHKHTSYGFLALFLLLLAFLPLFLVSRSVSADNSGVQIFAVVPGPLPKEAPVIVNIASGRVFTKAGPITVRGTCPDKTLVKIFKNDILGGAAFCDGGNFRLSMDLLAGRNALVARAYNSNDAAGPAALPIVVQNTSGGMGAGSGTLNSADGQFYVTSQALYQGVQAGNSLSWPVTINGGVPPYAVSVTWGDGKTDLISRNVAGAFDVNHTYNNPGPGAQSDATVIVKATDQTGASSYLQSAVIVAGPKTGLVSTVKQGYNWSATLRVAWQLLAVSILVILAFWLGEQREARLLTKPTRRLA